MQSLTGRQGGRSQAATAVAALLLAAGLGGCGGGDQPASTTGAGSSPATAVGQVPTEGTEGDPDGAPSAAGQPAGPPQPGILARQLTWKGGPPKSTDRWWSPGNEESVTCTDDAVKIEVEQDNQERVVFEARADGTASVSSDKQRVDDLRAQVQWGPQARIVQAVGNTSTWTYEDGQLGAGLLIETTVICGQRYQPSGSPSPSPSYS